MNRGGFVLVVAPAGFGKTTFLSAWAASSKAPVAWLTLSKAEADLPAFVRLLVDAIQHIVPGFGDDVLSLLMSQDLPTTESIARGIAGELADLPDPLAIVLDDYETIGDTSVQRLVADLVHMLSHDIMLVVASRTRPAFTLGRLRERGRLVEIGPGELLFRADEIQVFFDAAIGITLPSEALATVQHQTEGWAGCLQLVSQVLNGQPDPLGWVEGLGRRRHPYIEELLLDEVLARQTTAVQELLLRTAIVDKFCVELCYALLGDMGLGEPVYALLDHLERDQKLIEPADESGVWFRCPAPLRRALQHRLRSRLDPLAIADLHARACVWFAARGSMDAALEHALETGDPIRAATLVEGSIDHLLVRGDFPAVERLLERLPRELVERRPKLTLALAWLSNFHSRYESIPTVLHQLEALLNGASGTLDPDDVRIFRAEAAAAMGQALLVAGDGPNLMQQARLAYDALPPRHEFPRAVVTVLVGLAHQYLGETDEAVEFFETAFSAEPRADSLIRQHALWGMSLACLMAARPAAARRAAQRLLGVVPKAYPFTRAWAHYVHGLASYELNQLMEAREHFLEVDRLRSVAHSVALRNSLLGLAQIEQGTGQTNDARTTLEAVGSLPDVAQHGRFLAMVRTFTARLAFEAGDLDTVGDQLESFGHAPLPIPLETISFSPALTRARLLVAMGDAGRLAEASEALENLEVAAASINDSVQRIGVYAVRALEYQLRGNVDGALTLVSLAVSEAAPGGLIRTFVDLGAPMHSLLTQLARRSPAPDPYLQSLLAAFPTSSGPPQQAVPSRRGTHVGPELVESLTWRETEVLVLLDARMTNKEIAASLQISCETVKRHISNIYQKLMVGTRRAAVARAHALGVLPAAAPASMPRPDVRTA